MRISSTAEPKMAIQPSTLIELGRSRATIANPISPTTMNTSWRFTK